MYDTEYGKKAGSEEIAYDGVDICELNAFIKTFLKMVEICR